ncbi:ABC transporter ATP-binding protein [Staphylococcus chromogenes]|uniref:ABC transporter ATP-binding protein n=1 Tax=Staphylococcus chromogenes TaxID=46126 RepID=UPI0028FFAD40|nr:ABC transporter ATP-binding protein [Staphylococcus chromogenes]MDU0477594.1 ABC transporter ATP-binding protein [Staphylococcus chromogenes]
MKRYNSLNRILYGIKWPKKLIFTSIFIASLGSFFGLLIPVFTGNLVDDAVNGSLKGEFIFILILIFIINTILSGIGTYLLSKLGEKLIYSIRQKLWSHIMHLKMEFFNNNETGQIMSRVTEDTMIINHFVSQKLPNIFPSSISLIGSVIILLLLDWKITLLSLLVIPIFYIIMVPLGKVVQKVAINTQAEIANFSGLLGRVISDMPLVKSSLSEEIEIEKSKDTLQNIYKLGLKQATIFSIIQPISGMLILITVGILLGVGGYRVSTGAISSGVLVSMIFYIIQLSSPLTNLSTIITDYQRAVGASIRICEILNEEVESNKFGIDKVPPSGTLSFENVSFKYQKNLVLNNVSFVVPNNSITAIVGPSGSGKTTIFKLIQRFYDIDNGSILYSGVNINNFHLREWRSKIGYVMQNNPMMNGSVKENLLYGIENPSITLKQIQYYTKLANCHDVIMNLDDGYETLIGEKGNKISGGEKQRIDIARNLIKEPDILLLDEITSNLDSNSEIMIQEALTKFSKDKTLLIIAHRLSTIKKAHQIIFLDEGEITGSGNHTFLMRNHKKYREFVEGQMLNND